MSILEKGFCCLSNNLIGHPRSVTVQTNWWGIGVYLSLLHNNSPFQSMKNVITIKVLFRIGCILIVQKEWVVEVEVAVHCKSLLSNNCFIFQYYETRRPLFWKKKTIWGLGGPVQKKKFDHMYRLWCRLQLNLVNIVYRVIYCVRLPHMFQWD